MLVFDTLASSKKLQDVGVPPAQADAHVEVIQTAIDQGVATKQDVKDVRVDLEKLETRLTSQFEFQIELLRQEMKAMELRLTIKLGSLIALSVGLVATLVKLL